MRRYLVAIVLCTTLAAACGQKPGIHVAGTGGGTGSDLSTGGSDVGAGTGAGADAVAGGGGGGGTGAGTAGAGSATGGAGGTPSGGAGNIVTRTTIAGTGGGGADRTGVTDTNINIGIHAPVTGAAPFPNQSFQNGKDLYFRWIKFQGKKINGRDVTVYFEDDNYNPSTATTKCKKMVQDNKVFMLVGGGGTDQIVACAKYAASIGVPYTAEGVTEQALTGLAQYFALSMSYKQQGLLLAQYIKNVIKKTNVAMMRADTDNFNDAHDAFKAAAAQVGLNCGAHNCDLTLPKAATPQDAAVAAQQLKTTGADVVYPLMSPSIFINLVSAAHSQLYDPRYAGIGLTLGLNIVGSAICGSIPGGASFFSPFQGIDRAPAVDPDYIKAYNQFFPGQTPDDIGYVLWGAQKLIGSLLQAGGRDLTRQGFVRSVLAAKVFSTGVFPAVNYASSRFGGTAMHVLKADCANDKSTPFKTEFENKSSF